MSTSSTNCAISQPKKLLHVAFFPWLAFGHMIPFLNLAKFVARKGHRVSFISTPTNIQRLPKIPHHLSPLLQLVSLPFPDPQQNLPPNAEATIDLPHHLVPYLKLAYDNLQQPLTQFLEASTPDWIIYDFAPHWLPPIASGLNIYRANFTSFPAWAVCFMRNPNPTSPQWTKLEDLTVPPSWVPFKTQIAFRLYEARQIAEGISVNASGVSDVSRFLSCVSGSEVLLMRSSREMESEWINLVPELYRKPGLPVGLLPPFLEDTDRDNDTWTSISNWLDAQAKGKVVYVALGTEVELSPNQLTKLALGLEVSELMFFWVLRKGSEKLPEDFEQRNKDRGIIWKSWAPQCRVLSHESIGGLLTHCGWSSVIEGMCYGRVLIMLPFLGDQGLNARASGEKKVGVEIPRDENDGSFTRESVAGTVRRLVLGEEGRTYREKAKEMSLVIGDKDVQCRCVDKLAEYLEKHRCNLSS